MRMVSQSWQNCLEGPQNCPQGWVFVYFLPQGRNFAKLFCLGAGNLTTLKKFPGGQPGGGCWCLELTDALTSSFFPRLNFPSETRILLLYPTVPGLIFKACHWITCKYFPLCCNRPYSMRN